MDNKTIETLSINAVKDSIVATNFLDQYIADNDKEPSWDGFVYVYDDKTKRKENLKGRVPVQVKGTEKDDFSNEEISFSVLISDLTNYLYDGGVIFFVVYIGNAGLTRQIYYADMPPIKLRAYLKNAKNQKSKNISLKKFPMDSNEKTRIFFQFLENRHNQASFSHAHLFSLKELENQGALEEISIPVSTFGGVNFQTALFENDVYIYATTKGSPILQPIEIIPRNMITKETRSARISVGEKQFYLAVDIFQDVKSHTIYFGESFYIKVFKDETNIKINYKNSDNLRTLVVDLDFFLSFIETGSFQWDQIDFKVDCSNMNYPNCKLKEAKLWLQYAKRIVEMLELLGCKKDLNISTLENKDWKYIDCLITSLIDKKPVEFLSNDLPPIIKMNIGELIFILYFQKVDGKDYTYNIFDFFNTEVASVYQNELGEELSISQYAMLTADNLLEADNVRYDVLLPSFQKLEQHKETIIIANLFLEELLKAYDKDNSKKELLSVARMFAEWILESNDTNVPNDVKLLNKLQVEKRNRELTKAEIKDLVLLTEKAGVREEILVGAHLLLNQQVAAELHYEKLDKELQNEFKNSSMFQFWEGNVKEDSAIDYTY